MVSDPLRMLTETQLECLMRCANGGLHRVSPGRFYSTCGPQSGPLVCYAKDTVDRLLELDLVYPTSKDEHGPRRLKARKAACKALGVSS